MPAIPAVRVGVLGFDQAQANQSSVLIHSLDHVAVQLQLADDRSRGVEPSRTQRGKRHRLLTGTAQLLERHTMLILDERHQIELSTLGPRPIEGSLVTLQPRLRQRRRSRRSHRSEACLSPGGAPVVPQRVSLRTDR